MEDEKKEIIEITEDGDVLDSPEENNLLVTFSRPYVFDNESYDSIDLSGLDKLTANDMIAVNKIMERSGGATMNIIPEMSLEYACLFAAKATKKPVEFFRQLPPKEAIKLKNRVINFFYGED